MNAEEQKIADNLFFCFNWLLFQIIFVFLRHKNNETIKNEYEKCYQHNKGTCCHRPL